MADFADIRMIGEGIVHQFGQEAGAPGGVLEDRFFAEDGLHGEGGGTAERVAAVGMAVHEGFPFVIIGVEGVINFVGRNRDRHGHIAAGQSFRNAQDIGTYAGMVKRKHLPGSAESGRDFVGDQEDAVPVAERAQLRQELRRIDAHAGAALQQRFDDDRGGLVRMFREGGFRSGEAFCFAAFASFPIAAAVAV